MKSWRILKKSKDFYENSKDVLKSIAEFGKSFMRILRSWRTSTLGNKYLRKTKKRLNLFWSYSAVTLMKEYTGETVNRHVENTALLYNIGVEQRYQGERIYQIL